MSREIGFAAIAAMLVVVGFALSPAVSTDSSAASGAGKGYHNNAAQVAIPAVCAGYNTLNPAFKSCISSYPKPTKFQKFIMGGYKMP